MFNENETRRKLEDELRKELVEAYREGKKIKYKATEMLDAVTEKDDDTFKNILIKFVTSKTVPSGFITLWENERLDLSIEYIISVKDDGRYSVLFSDDVVSLCKKRLSEYGFETKA